MIEDIRTPERTGAPPSPFDASGTQFAWDSTSLGLLKACPRKYQLKMLENWQPRTLSVHLVFGLHYHKALERLELYLAEGYSRETAIREVLRKLLVESVDWISDHPNKNRWTLVRSVIWHFFHYEDDPAQTIHLSDGRPAVELTFRFEIDYGLFLCGHIDRVVSYGGDTYVMDHKTSGSTLGGNFFKGFNPSNQMTLYTLASHVALSTPVKGVLIDGAQIAVGFTEFARDITARSEPQLEEFLDGVYSWHATAKGYTKAGRWPMNETACDMFGGCEFKSICGTRPSVRQRFLETDFIQSAPRWNPLDPR